MDDPLLPPAPGNYRTAGLIMMIAGGANILLGLVWACGLAGSLYRLACCWAPFLAVGVGVTEIVVGAGVRAGKPSRWATTVSILGAVCGPLMCYGLLQLGLEGGASALLRGKDLKPWLDAALERERQLAGS